MKGAIFKYLLVLTLLLFSVENISVFSNPVYTKSASALTGNFIENEDSVDHSLHLFFREQDLERTKHCEIVEYKVIPNPISRNSKIKWLNNYNLQVIVYKSVSSSLLFKSILLSSALNNISRLLSILQI